MLYLFFGLLGAFILIFVIDRYSKISKNNKLKKIQAAWGKPKKESFDFDKIWKHADALNDKPFHRLSDQTIEDIDLYELFTFLDRTTCKVGQQFLFKKILEPSDYLTHPSEDLIKVFATDQNLRESIQLELLSLNNSGAYYITTLLKDKLLEKPKWFNLLVLNLFLVVGLTILTFKFPILLIALILLVTLNMILHYWNKNNTFQYLKSFPQLNNLIQVAKRFQKKGNTFYDQAVAKSISDLKPFQRKVKLINFASTSGIQSEFSFIANYLVEIIKAIFLVELFALYRITEEVEHKKAAIHTLFNFVGNLDAAISIASLRAGKEKTCQPTFVSAKKELHVRNLYHPLIPDCVTNNLTIQDKSILITGSNMSGKSTFLRTVIINSILAQSINTCFADAFSSPILKQYSTIRIDDNLLDGKSYYFQEVNIMASLIAEVASGHQNLFVLDEVFKGTNTVERIASAKAILSYLNRGSHLVIVATHDIELAEMLEAEYDLYHFTETVANQALHFDHTIKPGQLKTRNAIKILELSNYPEAVIKEAKEVSLSLGRK